MKRTIDPLAAFGRRLASVEKPARYLGGETGAVRKTDADFLVAFCFPDLYEIGMSNHALRVIAGALNSLPDVRCERVFAPAPDFEALLAETGVPLYTLESGTALADADLVAFTLGYELSATGILTILAAGGVPVLTAERGEDHPLVMAGGPVCSNPLPFAYFVDAFWIGEAEAGFYDLVGRMRDARRAGARRSELLALVASHESVWVPGKRAVRAVFGGFPDASYDTALPLPSVKPVQDHGVVEIMRGCPNGCRFCHAGYYYRPQRCRDPGRIVAEIDGLVAKGGFRQITLSSLSSGDYPGIVELVRSLNERYRGRGVSFQLPSLKVESFSLETLETLSEVRKGGLTFAVETPEAAWQLSVNKTVTADRIRGIVAEARRHGYRSIKFYFMVGLPIGASPDEEADAIAAFVGAVASESGIQVNVTIGVFVPKPHTPFQRNLQFDEATGLRSIRRVKDALRIHRNVKVSYHGPFTAVLEGIVARGDAQVGGLILEAWKRGARFDAWDDLFRADVWRAVLSERPELLRILEGYPAGTPQPWDDISIRVSEGYLERERERADDRVSTTGCIENCTERCGSCDSAASIVKKSILPENPPREVESGDVTKQVARILFKFSKTGKAAYIAHHTVGELLFRAFSIASLPISYSEGFNPLPRLDLGNPLPLGAESEAEYGIVSLSGDIDAATFVRSLDDKLPEGMRVLEAVRLEYPFNRKILSLGAVLRGAEYRFDFVDGADAFARAVPAALPGKSVSTRSAGNAAFVRLADPADVARVASLRALIDAMDACSAASWSKVSRVEQYAADRAALVDLATFFRRRGY